MAYFTLVGSNQPMIGAIKIEATASPDAPTDATSVNISRRVLPGLTSVNIGSIPISSVSDLTFSFLDKNVLSGQTYRYTLKPVVGETEMTPVNIDVYSSFSGIFISDSSGDYAASLDVGYTMKKNSPVGYVQPLASKYPHAVRNSSANYYTGSAEGLFVRYDENCIPDMTTIREYKNRVIEMLVNGLPKTIRTYDGNGWLVSIDNEPIVNVGDYLDSGTISFNWTEIGAFPSTGVVIL